MHCVRISLVLLVIVATMASASDNSEKRYYAPAEALIEFEKFVATQKREYKDEADKQVHFQAFAANLEQINKLNKENPSATYGINKFADYTEEERKTMFGHRGGK